MVWIKWGAIATGVVMLGGCAGAGVVLAVAQVAQVSTIGGAVYEFGKEVSTVQYRVRFEGKDREKWDNQLEMAKTLKYGRLWWRDDGKCELDGVLVPWSDPAAPAGEAAPIAGYASVLYSRKCPDQPEQKLLLLGKQEVHLRKATSTVFQAAPVQTMDLFENPVEARPAWWPQVVQRLLTLAPSSPDALRFVQHAQDNLVKLMPEQEASIRAAANASTHVEAAAAQD